MERIDITIDRVGGVTIEVNGVKGRSCRELTQELEKALAGKANTKLTGEYNLPPDPARLKNRMG